MKKIRNAFLFFAALPFFLNAQSIHQENILYGAAYYHEYMPYERLDEDVRMMKEAGISVVRVGESSWSLFEPREGEFEFAWMDRIIDKFHEAGIQVILGTPTYSILYEGSIFSDQIQTKIIQEAIIRAGIENPDHQFAWPLIAKSGINEENNAVHFYYNYSSAPIEFVYPHSAGEELVTEDSIEKGALLSVAPWDVLIVEENETR